MKNDFNSRRFMTGPLMTTFELARQKHDNAIQEEEALFVELPKMGDSYVGYSCICFYIFRVFTVISFIAGVLIFIFLPIKTSEDIMYYWVIVITLALMLLASIVAYLSYQYYMNTRILFFNDSISVRKYMHKAKTVSYAELRESMQEKGIRLKWGCLEIPYNRGWISISINKEKDDNPIFSFIKEKCDYNIPIFSSEERFIVQKMSLFPFTLKLFIVSFLFDLFIFIAGYMTENITTGFWKFYLYSFTNQDLKGHCFLVFVLAIIVFCLIIAAKSIIPYILLKRKYKF